MKTIDQIVFLHMVETAFEKRVTNATLKTAFRELTEWDSLALVMIVAEIYANYGAPQMRMRFSGATGIKSHRSCAPEQFCSDLAAAAASRLLDELGLPTEALPMRYNFPTDRTSDTLYPHELDEAVIIRYLRTDHLDRHRIFVSGDCFDEFFGASLGAVMKFSGSASWKSQVAHILSVKPDPHLR